MGYMGLDSWISSDMAFDMTYGVIKSMCQQLQGHLKDEENRYNTPGVVNVGLFFEAFLSPLRDELDGMDFVSELAYETAELLEQKIKLESEWDWGDEENKLMHLNAYKRILQCVKQFCN